VLIVLIFGVALLNIRGTRQSANVQGVATAIKAGVIVLLSAVLIFTTRGAPHTGTWWPDHFSLSTLSGAVTGMIGVLWAYEGWQYVTFSAGETLDPQKTFARGIVIGTLALIGIYVFANVGYFVALGVDGVAKSTRVAAAGAGSCSPGWSSCRGCGSPSRRSRSSPIGAVSRTRRDQFGPPGIL